MTQITIQVVREDRVCRVALNRPETHNAFNAQLIAELTETFDSFKQDNELRAVVLRGEGKSFCAGADVNWMKASLELSEEENLQDALRMSDMFAAIDECPVPVICAVHGAALGGGMGLVSACDIVLSADDAKFGFTECRLGILPAVISRFVVPKVGSSWARRYFASAERFTAVDAMAMGLVHQIVAAETMEATISERLASILKSGPLATRAAKELIRGVLERTREENREYTARLISQIRISREGQEGLRAFLERREPQWEDPS
jgi:methylglutaconyl-CoA hydratase